MISLFASTYPNITESIRDLIGDRALNLHRTTKACNYDTDSIEDAVSLFRESEFFWAFCAEHPGRVYIYRYFDGGGAQIVG